MQLARFIAFFAVTGILLLLSHVYLYRRLVRDVTARPALRRIAQALLIVLAVGAVAARPLSRLLPDGPVRAMGIALLVWVGLVVYLLIATLGLDAIRWITSRFVRRLRPALLGPGAASKGELESPERRALLARGVAGGAALVAGTVGGFGAWRAFHPPDITEVVVRLRGLPKAMEGLTIAHLTDIHVGPVIQRRFLDELVARTNALKADLVAITGDLVDGTVERLGPAVAALRQLRSRYGTYFVSGNHEYYAGIEPWMAFLPTLGIHVLRNRTVSIGDGGASIDLIGVDDWGGMRRGGRSDYDLAGAVAGRDPSRASVLLSHQPGSFDDAVAQGIGLQLSGHTHGGQMFPGTGIAHLIWGERTSGLSRQGGSQLFVSRGCGFVGPPMRVGSPPEIARVVLLPA